MADPDAVNAAVGRNLRRLREHRAWTLEELARRAAVSKRMLIEMEQSRTNPSLGTLCRVAEALDVSLARLVAIDEAPAVQVVSGDQGAVLWQDDAGSSGRLLVGSDRTEHLELWTWCLEPGGVRSAEAHLAGTEELLHVAEGVLTLVVDATTHTVEAGGAAAFAADRPHAYRNDGDAAVRFTMAVVQPESDLDPATLHPTRTAEEP